MFAWFSIEFFAPFAYTLSSIHLVYRPVLHFYCRFPILPVVARSPRLRTSRSCVRFFHPPKNAITEDTYILCQQQAVSQIALNIITNPPAFVDKLSLNHHALLLPPPISCSAAADDAGAGNGLSFFPQICVFTQRQQYTHSIIFVRKSCTTFDKKRTTEWIRVREHDGH